ncbi:MAG: hypothetical protein H6538_04795 [Bacteroidales bacterium]|nr:hypothetical protein [Bacteroidales bacterium]MCB8998966.1 hypothetical protein [Bacteroidales bacterium]MCB9013747.1 hypothetical protein [Bacteroidales bacterium]
MKPIYILIILFLALNYSCRKSDYIILNQEVVHDNGGGTGTVTWKAENSYILDGFVFVNDGQVLTIEPGTVIEGKAGKGVLASALIVARGGKIIAEGTSDKPIIFTAEGDDLNGSVPLDASGLWGGLIILGNATVNTPTGESFIEGIPISEPRGVYGGSFDDENSGILRYVSIRHGGTNIGEGNEINGLTLGGVGRKTVIDHVEIVSNEDDGIEFFGGTVDCSNIAVAFCGDDAFDFDEGYSGKCQFMLGILDPERGDHLAEHSGAPLPGLGKPFSHPEIYNATYIGRYPAAESYMMSFDENAGGAYKNCIFLNAEKGIGIQYDDLHGSFKMWEDGKLEIANNVFLNVSPGVPDSLICLFPNTGDLSLEQSTLLSYYTEAGNETMDPGFQIEDYHYHLLPASTVFENLAVSDSPWFEQVSFKGAFGSNNWLAGWSYLWKENIVY